MDRGMKGDHPLSHQVTGGIGVIAAGDRESFAEEVFEPERIGSGSGGGKAATGRGQGQATQGINGRFAEDDGVRGGRSARGEVTKVLA